MSALTNNQKQRLAILARDAYATVPQTVRDAADFNDWRHQEVAKACGKLGLRCASQTDYNHIQAHFLHLLGRDGQALKSLVRAQTEPLRQARVVLQRECNKAGVHIRYAEAICKSRHHGMTLDDLNETALWKIIFTIRNRKRIKTRSASHTLSSPRGGEGRGEEGNHSSASVTAPDPENCPF